MLNLMIQTDNVMRHVSSILYIHCLFLQVSDSFSVQCISALVLDEDGTCVDTEEFFQTLPENAVLMVLEKEEKWTPHPV